MWYDTGLALFSLIVGIIGTLLEHPPKWIKITIVCLLVGTGVFTILKAWEDEKDKDFMQTALIASLIPSNASYGGLSADVRSQFPRELDRIECNHGNQGMSCYLSSSTQLGRHATLVLNSSELSQMYANDLRGRPKVTAALVRDACDRSYNPTSLDEDFKDKVGILGTSVFFNMFAQWVDYNYDDSFGVKIMASNNGKSQDVYLSPSDLASFQQKRACDLFYDIEQSFRAKFKEQVTDEKH